MDVVADIVVVKKTFRLPDVFLLQPLMPPSMFRNIFLASSITQNDKHKYILVNLNIYFGIPNSVFRQTLVGYRLNQNGIRDTSAQTGHRSGICLTDAQRQRPVKGRFFQNRHNGLHTDSDVGQIF